MSSQGGFFSSDAYLYKVDGQTQAVMFNRDRSVTAELNESAFAILHKVFDVEAQPSDVILSRMSSEFSMDARTAESELDKLMYPLMEAGLVNLVMDSSAAKVPSVRVGRTNPPIVSTMFEVTRRCNLECFYCYNNSNSTSTRKNEMTTQQIFLALDKLKEIGVVEVNFTGGEPLARTDMLEIISYAKKQGFYVVLFSNATLMDDKLIQTFSDIGLDGIRTSLDAGSESLHNQIRGAHSFGKTIKSIAALKKQGIKVSVSCTISDINRDGFKPILKLMDDLLVDELVVDGVLPTGRSCSVSAQKFTLEQRKKNFGIYKEYYSWMLGRKGNDREKLEVSNITRNDKYWSEQKASGINTFCGVGDTLLYISSNGNLGFCEILNEDLGDEYNLGNIIIDDLIKLWGSSRKVLDFRGSECSRYTDSSCKLAGLCKGGCRARAIIEEKNRNSPDYNSCLHAKAAEMAIKVQESLAVKNIN